MNSRVTLTKTGPSQYDISSSTRLLNKHAVPQFRARKRTKTFTCTRKALDHPQQSTNPANWTSCCHCCDRDKTLNGKIFQSMVVAPHQLHGLENPQELQDAQRLDLPPTNHWPLATRKTPRFGPPSPPPTNKLSLVFLYRILSGPSSSAQEDQDPRILQCNAR